MSGRKYKLIRRQVYKEFPKKMNLDKVSFKSFIKDFFKKGMPIWRLVSAWKYRKWWNSLKAINPFRFNQYRRGPEGMIRNTGLRKKYKMHKRYANDADYMRIHR